MSRMRVSDADRDRVAEVLREAAAEGRITLDELEERLDLVYAAKTYADLEPITADLPTASTAPAPPVGPPATAARTPDRRAGDGEALVIQAQGDSVTRKGRWRVPGRIEVNGKYGRTRLDFREAEFSTEVVEVHVDASWGEGDLILPEGATAQVDADASWFGTLRSSVDSIRRPPNPHFVVTGKCQGGSLKVRYKSSSSWSGLWEGLGL